MGDVRGLLLAPATLVLQVAHPTVGAAVADHSDFVPHPWRRLLHTMHSAIRFTYGTDAVVGREADRLRRLHAGISGVDAAGLPYSALDPAASAWVHLTLGRFGVETQRVLGEPLGPAACATFYQEWRVVGGALGVPASEMPSDWTAFLAYFGNVVDRTLEDNRSVRDVLDAVAHPRPPARVIPPSGWAPVATRLGVTTTLFTVGTLPPTLRSRLGLAWSERQQQRLEQRAARIRAAARALPAPLRYYPQIAPVALPSWWEARRSR